MDIDIIIPNYNGKELLQHCLYSIQRQDFTDFLVTIVDNGSTDGSLEMLQTEFPDVRVISWTENRGFSAAVNEGIRATEGSLVFLLNNDTELAEDCLSNLFAAAKHYKEYDFFAAKMINYNDRSRLDGAGDGFLRGGVGYRLGTMELDNDCYSISRHVFGACAGAAVFRRVFFDQVGCFDDDFFAYLEDVDLNIRANSREKKCWFVADAKVYHVGSATTGSKINPFTVKLSTRNNLNVLVKNYPLLLLVRFMPTILLYQFFWFLFVIKKRQFGAYFKGLASFIKSSPSAYAKRKENLIKATLPVNKLAEIMSSAEKEVILSIMNRRREKGKGNQLLSLYMKLFL